MENVWQFSKVYEEVPKTTKLSRWNSTVIWDYPKESHFVHDPTDPQDFSKGKLTPGYWNWRKKGMAAQHAIRYPVGHRSRHKCLFAVAQEKDGSLSSPLDYIESRKEFMYHYIVN